MNTMKALLVTMLLTLVGMGTAVAQVPQINHCLLPQDYFVNEEFCFTLELEETVNTGFGPYLLIMLPPGVQLQSAAFTSGSTLALVDTSNGTPLKDPHRNSGTLSDSITLPVGWTLHVLDYPVGSVTLGGVALSTTICLIMDPNQVTIGVPLDVQFQAGYIYGGTPTGSNGPTLGPLWSGQVTPQLYLYKKTSAPLPRHDRTPGPDWPLLYSLIVDIANGQTVTNLVFHDDLPDSLMFIPGSITAPPGCTINASGITPGQPGGSFDVTCPSGTGTLGSADVLVQYSGYAVNVLDESMSNPCDEYKVVNLSTLSTNQGPTVTSTDTVRIYNVTFQQESTPTFTVPGSTVTTTINIQVSDYITAMDSFFMVIRVEDGLDFTGNSTLDGLPVSPASIQYHTPTVGATWVVYDLVALNGGPIQPGDSLILTYETMVRQNYQATGDQVLARDVLSTFADGHYHLVDELPGIQGCYYSYKASVAVIPNTISKEVIGGSVYVPGDMVTYRLRMILPSGDANNVVFTDYLPIPVHNVANLNLNWGGPNIQPGPNHYGGAGIPTITTIPGNNALVIDFGDVISFSSPETLEVLIHVPVTTVPFANGLIHSNFLQVESDNTPLSTEASLELTQIWIGAPMLSIVKGVAAVQNPLGQLTLPGSFPVNSNAFNVDANDTITFVSTITNIGGAQAFNVQVVDPVSMYFSGCQLLTVRNGAGNPYPYSGTLFTGPNDTLVIDSMAATGPDSIALITYCCVMGTNVNPWQTVRNTMSIAWASAIGQDSLFDRIRDSATVRMATPQVAKAVNSIVPGHAGMPLQAHVGEIVNYVATIRFPEGVTDSVIWRDGMGVGLAFAGFDSIVASPGLSSSLGPISSLFPTVDSIGSGPVNRDRRMDIYMGDITNVNPNNAVAESIKIYYKARVLNTTANVRGTLLPNDIHMSWYMPNTYQTQNIYATAPSVRILEPSLSLTKSFMTNHVNPGDSVFVEMTFTHTPTSDATAYDIVLTDTLPFGMNFIPASFSGACPSSFTVQPGYLGGVVYAMWDSLELGASCQLRFKVQVDNAFPACNDIVNRGNLHWESVSDPLQATLPNCPLNPYGVERTGFSNAAGQLNNYKVSSYDTLHVGIPFTGIPQITGNAPVCQGTQLELNCTPYVAPNVQYIWTTPQGTDTTTTPQLIIYPATAADSGYYTVVINMGGCNSATSNLYLATVTPSPTALATGDGTFCAGQDAQLSATAYPAGSYNYNWTGPNGFISNLQNPVLHNLTPQMAGNYSVQASANGCTSAWSAPVNIQVLPRPVVATQHDTLTCSYGIVDLVLDATPLSGTGPFTFYWTGPGGYASTMQYAIIPNARAINQGNYIVTMTDSFGCTSLPMTAVVDITDAPPTPVITQQGAFCPGDALTLVTTPYTGSSVSYYWVTPNGPVTTSVPSLNIPSLSTNDAGLYAVVAEIDGCQTLMSALSTVVVNAAPTAPNPTATYGDPLNCAGDTLWLSAQGDSSHIYLWDGPNGFTGNGMNTYVPNADPNYNGSYEVTVSNGNCTTVASVTINSILPYPATPSLVQPMTACEGDPVIIQANPYSGNVVSYTWSTPNGLQFTSTPSLLLQPVTMGDSGNYAMNVNVNGCPSLMSGTVQLVVNPTPATPSIVLNQDTLCEGDTLLLSTANVPGASYTWSGPAGYHSSNQVPPAIPGVTPMNTGVFELFVVFNGCRSAVASDTVLVNPRPAAPTLYTASPLICEGEPITLSTNGNCGTNVFVSPMGLSGATLNSPSQYVVGSTTQILDTDTAYIAGNWTAICVAANGCWSAPSAPVAVTITPKPATPSVTHPAPQCEGNTLALAASSNVSNATYIWSGPNGFTHQGQNATLYNVAPYQAGDYGVVVMANGCPSDTAWTTVAVNPAPAAPNPTVAGPVCKGGLLNLLANATATSYYWTGPNGFVSTQQDPSIPGVNPSHSGYYHLTLVENACSSSVGVVNVQVVDNTVAPVLTSNAPLCEGQMLTLSTPHMAGSTVQYIWYGPNGTSDTTLTPVRVDTVASVSLTGWYGLQVLVDGCPSPQSASVHVVVNPKPATPVISSNAPVCAGETIVLGTSTQADDYRWTGPNGFSSNLQQPAVITGAQPYHSGHYTLKVMENGCASDEASTLVQVSVAGAAPTLQSNSPVCLGDTIHIHATAGADSYEWSCPNGATTITTVPTLVITPATLQHNGQFTVRGAYNGCFTETSAAITVVVGNAAQENAFAGNDQLVCGNALTTTLQAGNTTVPGLWTTHSSAVIASPSHAQTDVRELEPGIDYVFYWTIQSTGCGGESSTDSVRVRVAQNPLAYPNVFALKDYARLLDASILLNDSLWLQDVNLRVVEDPMHGTYTTNPDQTINYIPMLDFIGKDSLQYEICLEECPDMCDRAWVWFEINPKIIVPDLITPNGDAVNDAFEMIGLENYPHNQLLVFNRWGNEVFAATDYQNDWKGTYRGEPLPDGTYFWIFLDATDGSEILRGYLTIHR